MEIMFIAQFLRENWLILILIGGLAAAWLILRTQGTALSSIEEFDQRVRSGRPIVVEIYSNT
jgi:hypothetical protein